ncbi:MAG: hypothetical protein RLW87_20700 [Alphaproteobacteria bacterium]
MPGKRIKVGDRITFKAVTRWNCNPVTRKVNGFDDWGRPTVAYGGWREFVVRKIEVKALNGEPWGTGRRSAASRKKFAHA